MPVVRRARRVSSLQRTRRDYFGAQLCRFPICDGCREHTCAALAKFTGRDNVWPQQTGSPPLVFTRILYTVLRLSEGVSKAGAIDHCS